MVENNFSTVAESFGVDSVIYLIRPDIFLEDITGALKIHARFLKKINPEIKHSKAIDIVTEAAGFPSWHAFTTTITNLKNEYIKPGLSREAIDLSPFSNAAPLLIRIPEGLAPTAEQLFGLERLGISLSKSANMPYREIMDMLAYMQNADDLDDLKRRRPENSAGPLYTFNVYPEGDGAFKESPACRKLIRDLDGGWQNYDSKTKKEKSDAHTFAAAIIKKRRDFTEGWLALATMEVESGNYALAEIYYKEGIASAESVIPKDFKGKIIWGWLENRSYHRLLFNYMRFLLDEEIPKAIKLARKQLRLNPSDNLGVRFELPIMLAADKQFISAEIALKKISKDSSHDPQALFIMAICNLAMNKGKEGVDLFLQALFQFPGFRPIIYEDATANLHQDKWHRGEIPDVESMFISWLMIKNSNPSVIKTLESILASPLVAAAEIEAEKSHIKCLADLRSSHNPYAMDAWGKVCVKLAGELSEKH